VRFVNEEESRGLKRGGVLNVVRHELELSCDAANIPDEIIIDLAGYDIGDSIHISAVALPEGATPTIEDRDFTIATLVGSSGMKAEAAEAEAEAAEAGEVPTVGEEAAEGEASADKTEA
jgi:large subunit ribosomal protein L25